MAYLLCYDRLWYSKRKKKTLVFSNFCLNVENLNVEQLRNSKSWFETDAERRTGMQQTQGNTLGRGKKPTYLTTDLQNPWSSTSPKCLCPHRISPSLCWWLNEIYMHSTATKALLPQTANCDGHMFLIRPWEDNRYFSLIVWKQGRKKNVQKLNHTSSKCFTPRTWKY